MRARDLVIIGAGPAGMAAAITATENGIDTLVLDEHPTPGGQIYRAAERPGVQDQSVLGPDYAQGRDLVRRFRTSNAEYQGGSLVWEMTPERCVHITRAGAVSTIEARHVLLATGAIERPFPVPGWTLPGVMSAGSAQILLKTAGVVPVAGVVLAGAGPLLLLLAWQYLRAGVQLRAILDTTAGATYASALRHLPAALTAGDYIAKGIGMIRAIRRAGVPIHRGIDKLNAHGQDTLESVEFSVRGRQQRIDTELLLLHQGVTPNVNLAMSIGCQHAWDANQLCWRPETDTWGHSSLNNIYIAGDGASVGGASSAELAGQLVALEVSHKLGVLNETSRDAKSAPLRSQLIRSLRVRPFLERLYRPRDVFRIPPDNHTIVCRCEEVTAGTVRSTLAHGAADVNRLKSITRCGMGPCQGRYCGLTICELVAHERAISPQSAGYFRLRPPVKPVPVSDLLAFDTDTTPAEVRLPGTTETPR